MGKGESIFALFSKISQRRDQLTIIGIVVDDDGLIKTTVDGLPKS
jgi:hypothetical protein